jgi:hypothetical protein
MARGYEQNRERWEKQLQAVDDNIKRVDRKIAAEQERSKGLRARREALEADRENYLRALGRDNETASKPAHEGRG